jgi:hypothetical protein
MAAVKTKVEAQNPLILRCNRLMDAFAKSDDERDFYLDRKEGFIVYVDLDKTQEELTALNDELEKNSDRYCLIPKLTFYETKKIMEGFVNEKVYDIDTKEKLLDIIQSKEARENFLDFINDHHAELEKWQQYYQERSRIRIIEWLRQNHFHFVFEEDLDMPRPLIEKLKENLFKEKVDKDLQSARKELFTKAKIYYSNEALNPRPKRGRPPKQAAKQDIQHQVSTDIYTTVPSPARPFLFVPDINSSSLSLFSSKFDNDTDMLAHRKPSSSLTSIQTSIESWNQKLASLRNMTSRWAETPRDKINYSAEDAIPSPSLFDEEEDDESEWEDETEVEPVRKATKPKSQPLAVKPKSTKHIIGPLKKTALKKDLEPKKKTSSRFEKTTPQKISKSKPKQKIAPKRPAKRPAKRLLRKR